MPRHYYQLRSVTFDRLWAMGPVRFLPAGLVRDSLSPALDVAPRSDSVRIQQELIAERLTEWANDAVVEVTAMDNESANHIAEEALAILRFYMRPHVQVNVEIHKIGLAGEIPEAIRHQITLWDEGKPIAATGWRRIGGTVSFRFAATTLDTWDADPSLQFLGDQLGLPADQRSNAGRRSLTALKMLDAGLRSLEPKLRVLCAAIAVEVMFSRNDRTDAQTTAIARRIAYLTCRGGCGRTGPLCLYTEKQKGHKALVADLRSLADRGKGWQCSAFLGIAAPDAAIPSLQFPPLFTARNAIAHEGEANLTERDHSHLIWIADQAILGGLAWYAGHVDTDMVALDAEIGGGVPTDSAAAT